MYAGKEIYGHGEDFLWVDAFAHIAEPTALKG